MIHLAMAANAVVALGYLIIAALIGKGLMDSGQLGRRNPLGTATVAIFLSCGLGHAVHVEHLILDPSAQLGVDWHLAMVDVATALVAVTYLSLRRRFSLLWAAPEMFSDAVRTEAQQQIRDAEALFRTSFDGAPIGMALMTPGREFIRVNEAFERVVGWSSAELTHKDSTLITHPEDLACEREHARAIIEDGTPAGVRERRMVRPDGTVVPVLVSMTLIRHPSGLPRHFVVQMIDLSDQKAAAAAALAADGRFSALYDASPIGIAVVEDDRVVKVNRAMLELLVMEDLTDRSFCQLFVEPDRPAVAAALLGAGPVDARLAGAADGRVVELHVAPLPDASADGRIVQVLDVSSRIAHEARLRDLADHDALTGLLNRRRLSEELHIAAASCKSTGTMGALLLLDLDGFKLVNDSLGHVAGDRTLVAIASTLRAVSGPEAIVARVGGDEFAVLLRSANPGRAVITANTILGALRNRGFDDGSPVVTASIGIAVLGDDTTLSTDDVLARADLAVYDAKDAGRNRLAVYDPASGRREAVALRQRWIDRLHGGRGEMVAYAQPIIPTDTADRTRRIELLVRYRAEDGTFAPPGDFLPIAEQTGLIGDIDRWMLRQAAELIRASPEPLHVAVNLSAQTFIDATLPVYLDQIGVGDLPPGLLMTEITETAALADRASMARIVAALRSRGCQLALDDFGSGFATFDYLQRLDVDLLKIDGAFVRDLATNPTSRMIVESIVGLADKLRLPVVAEHVETPDALQQLIAIGVEYVQGYLFSKPQPVQEMLDGWERQGQHRQPLHALGRLHP